MGLIGVIATIAAFSIKALIQSQKTSASVINVSGKQRMYSQRIALFANSLNLATDSIEVERHKRVIEQMTKAMLFSHNALLNGNDSLNLPKVQSEAITKMYFENPINLNQQIEGFLNEVDRFLTSTDSVTQKNAFIIINASASGRLLLSLDKMVRQYELETNQKVKRLEQRVMLTLVSIILLLILEFLFIFKPLVQANHEHERKLTRQNTRLESLNQDLEQFIYAASHDLKTPIRGLHNLIQFLEADFSDDLTAQSEEYITLIKSRVQRIYVLIDGLMRYGAISRERSTQTEYNLQTFIERQAKNFNNENITISIPNPLPTISTNPIWMNELFTNLIENAIKYNPQTKCEITIQYTEKEHFHKFSIKDNGHGVDEKYHERMFKLFQTLDNKDNNPTAGIGLAIVKKIITELGGKVWIESEKEEHFTVLFTIPKVNET